MTKTQRRFEARAPSDVLAQRSARPAFAVTAFSVGLLTACVEQEPVNGNSTSCEFKTFELVPEDVSMDSVASWLHARCDDACNPVSSGVAIDLCTDERIDGTTFFLGCARHPGGIDESISSFIDGEAELAFVTNNGGAIQAESIGYLRSSDADPYVPDGCAEGER